MKRTKTGDLAPINGQTADNVVIFETIQGEENVLRAQVFRGGRKHKLFMLAVPEDRIGDIKDDLIYSHELEMETA